MDYDLNGLNPRDFEHLVQALALKTISTGITPFGDGPDGGREASYRGKMMYPSSRPWDGYLVVQAKFRKKSTGVPAKDGVWLLQQLRSDLGKFDDPKRTLPRPDYYLIATNVVLTAASGSGFKDRVIAELEKFKGLKSFDIWDYDKICRLLDGYPEIYRHYAGFITSGDVLTKVMDVFDGQAPDFFEVMSLFLQKELRSEQFVKLEQAGHTIDQKTSLANVFVDLRASEHPISGPPDDQGDGIVAEILRTGASILRPSLCNTEEIDRDAQYLEGMAGRYVIVGGPGQGKSTVGQFLCQMYRAAILQDCPVHTIAPEVRSVLNQIEKQCQQDHIELPTARRFPVRIVLDQFATDLANGEVSSLLSFILKQIADASQHTCSADDLRRWLRFYPWLIVLDGLDEVPATSNRNQVLETTTEFFSQVSVLDADVLVVATTRPQGYNNEFSPRFYTHRFLTPLSEAKAMHYAERLTQARFGAEQARKAKILKRLAVALSQETTARLMQTPLQVTIMATLVDQIGQPPQERWRLFQQYYEVIYRRETERDIPASRILQQRKADVNAIHNRVGLLLQTESELAGNSDARLTSSKFRKIVRARIAEEGYEGEELELHVDEITQAALNRLVFLVGIESDRIGFEIRSLQEFTAAEALMDGGDAQIRARLEVIAPNSHWRNAFLFAAGKCFAERQFLRDMIVGICDQLNDLENDKLAGATLTGSQLALDILQDGVAHEQPNFARSLARYALKLISVNESALNTRLSGIYTPTLEKLFKDAVSAQVGEKSLKPGGAWIVLRSLAAGGVVWAKELIDAKWPPQRDAQLELLQDTGDESNWFRQRVIEMLPPLTPKEMSLLMYSTSIDDELSKWSTLMKETRGLSKTFSTKLVTDEADPNSSASRFRLKSVSTLSLQAFTDLEFSLPSWAPYLSAQRFEAEPSATILAKELRWLGEIWKPNLSLSRSAFAWPLQACLSASANETDLIQLAKRAEQGKLGQITDWLEAEHRWTTIGLGKADFAYMTDVHWPFDNQIGKIGFPFSAQQSPFLRNDLRLDEWDKLLAIYHSLGTGKMRETVANSLYRRLLSGAPDESQEMINLTAEQLRQLLKEQETLSISPRPFELVKLPETLDQSWLDFFEWLGDIGVHMFPGKCIFPKVTQLARAFEENPEKRGLLKTLGAFAVSGSEVTVSENILRMPPESEDLTRAALLLRTSQGRWSESEAQEMAAQACSLSNNINTVFYMLRTLENHTDTIPHPQRVLLALSLREEAIMNDIELFTRRKTLKELVQSRLTGISEPARWDGLGLPAIQ